MSGAGGGTTAGGAPCGGAGGGVGGRRGGGEGLRGGKRWTGKAEKLGGRGVLGREGLGEAGGERSEEGAVMIGSAGSAGMMIEGPGTPGPVREGWDIADEEGRERVVVG